MAVFALLFIVSFLALIFTLVVMYIRKGMNKGKGDVVVEKVKLLGRSPTADVYEAISQLKNYELSYDLSSGRGDCSEKGVWYVDGEKVIGLTDEELHFKGGNSSWGFSRSYDLESSMMKREVNETQEKWKHTLPKHSTRIKLRNSRKLRNKRKGKK